mgnify:FL=1
MAARGNSTLINAVIFIVLEVAAVFMISGTRSLQNIWINRATHRVLGGIWKGSENLRSYFGLREENRALSEENVRLTEALRHLEGQRLALAGAVSDTVTGHYSYTPATIVKMSRNSQHNYIILDKGRADGITPKSGIVAANGVVGVVDAVDEHFCYGLTLQNVLVSVSARAGHTGAVAPLEWSGTRSNLAALKNLPTHLSVSPGDTVWTSGFSGIFPPDIPLGITGRSRTVDGAVQEVEVDLFLDFGALRYVAIVKDLDGLEKGGLER